MSVSVTDQALIGEYEVQIVSSFQTPTSFGDASNESTKTFSIFIEDPNPCNNLACDRNQLIVDRVGYVEPTDFTIGVELIWGQTIYDNYNDTKHEACWKQDGYYDYQTFADTQTYGRPVCNYPIYELVDAHTLAPMSNAFGASNIEIQFY